MNGILLLIVICTLYYVVYKYYPDKLSDKTHTYFGIFVIGYAILYYFFVFETGFTHKVFHNIYESSQQPLYTFNAQGSNAALYHQQNPNADIKEQLLMRQGSRCAQCQNYLIGPQDALLSYHVPLQAGGHNDPSNLVAICSGCHMFK
jgi:hypothetical protein